MMDYWIRFVTSGNPGGAATWTRFQANDPRILVLVPGAITIETDFAKTHHCELWNSIARELIDRMPSR